MRPNPSLQYVVATVRDSPSSNALEWTVMRKRLAPRARGGHFAPKWYGPDGQGNAREDLEAFANPAGNSPVAVIAFDDAGSPIGIAALKTASLATH